MDIGGHVGKIGTCSECNKQKMIGLEWTRGTDANGNIYSPYLRCEDCISLSLEKDENQ
ncbi:MAG: hypothetical protein ACRD80_01525 [Nitrososphaeraceae archaeon]